jgi:hypothetical protein
MRDQYNNTMNKIVVVYERFSNLRFMAPEKLFAHSSSCNLQLLTPLTFEIVPLEMSMSTITIYYDLLTADKTPFP